MDFLTSYTVYFISFVAFIGGAYYYGYPLLLKAIDQYINDIQDQFYQAEKKHQQAEEALVKTQDKHEEAVLKAEKILKAAHAEVKHMNALHKQEIQEYEERQKKLGEEKISRLERAISDDIKSKIIEQTIEKSEDLFVDHSTAAH